jgi:membrane protein DedA with SNARE-associated domain
MLATVSALPNAPMQSFLNDYGVAAIFLAAILENDVVFIMTGVMVHLGVVHPESAFLACLAGALVHDSLWFWLGHARADSIRSSRIYRRLGPAVERLAVRFGPWELLLSRFIYGTRNPSLVFWGTQRLSILRFAAIELTAFMIWGGALTGLGYFLSDRAQALIGEIGSVERFLLGALGVALLIYLGVRLLGRQEVKKYLLPPPGGGS